MKSMFTNKFLLYMEEKVYQIGDTYEEKRVMSKNLVSGFGAVTKDYNPIHFDDEFAKNTLFKETICHGMLVVSQFSGILGTKFPGKGTIYLRQEVKFLKPVKVGAEALFRLTIEEIISEKKRLVINTSVFIEGNIKAIDGKATVIFSNYKKDNL